MLDDQAPFRRLAKAALDQWFSEAEAGLRRTDPGPRRSAQPSDRARRRAAPRPAPRRGRRPAAHALGIIVGTDAMLALTDGVGLDVAEAKSALLDAGRWLIAGALAELQPD